MNDANSKKDYTHEQCRQFKSGFVMQKVGVVLSGYNENTRQFLAEFEDGTSRLIGLDELHGLQPNNPWEPELIWAQSEPCEAKHATHKKETK
jgi:hypothetical protein